MNRTDIRGKVDGSARYASDWAVERMLHVACVRPNTAYANILSIDPSRALGMPGVRGVFSACDLPQAATDAAEKPVLSVKTVFCSGDAVALVAADSREAAIRAASAVHVAVEPFPALHTPEEACQSDARILHGSSNVCCTHSVRKGDVATGFAEADVTIEQVYTTQRTYPAALEPDAVLAIPQGERIELIVATKHPFAVRDWVAEALQLDKALVRVVHPTIGGGFGGRLSDNQIIAARAALCALKTGFPCKLQYSREEVMREGIARHPFQIRLKLGAKADGRLVALEADCVADAGAYRSKSYPVLFRAAVEVAGPYRIPHVSVNARAVYTNNIPSDAVRGFGSPQAAFAIESAIDELAEKLGMSHANLSRRNLALAGERHPTGHRMRKNSLPECLDELEREMRAWRKLPQKNGRACGIGISVMHRGEGKGPAPSDEATAQIWVDAGGVRVSTGVSEVGQGAHTALTAVVSDVLQIAPERIRVLPADTDAIIDCGATAGSRGSLTSGNAVYLAACGARDLLLRNAAALMNVPDGAITLREGRFCYGDSSVDLLDAAGAGVHCTKQYGLRTVQWDFAQNNGEPYSTYSFGATGVMVEVDRTTGEVNVCKICSVHDVGKALFPEGVRGQVRGGVCMALGGALFESAGAGVENFDRYLLPTAADAPACDVRLLEIPQPDNPLGIHGIGESSTVALAPALTAAIYDAVGVRVRSLPLTLESVFRAAEEGI